MAGAAGGVVAASLVVAKPDDGGDVEGAVAGAVPAAVQPVPVGLAGGCGDWRDTAEVGEGGFGAEPGRGCRRW